MGRIICYWKTNFQKNSEFRWLHRAWQQGNTTRTPCGQQSRWQGQETRPAEYSRWYGWISTWTQWRTRSRSCFIRW